MPWTINIITVTTARFFRRVKPTDLEPFLFYKHTNNYNYISLSTHQLKKCIKFKRVSLIPSNQTDVHKQPYVKRDGRQTDRQKDKIKPISLRFKEKINRHKIKYYPNIHIKHLILVYSHTNLRSQHKSYIPEMLILNQPFTQLCSSL